MNSLTKEENMVKHDYFGKVEKKEFWSGFRSEFALKIPYFEKEVKIYLGNQYDEDYEEIDTPPSNQQLAEFEITIKDFLSNIDMVIADIHKSAFDYYQKRYARYYEQDFEVLFSNDKVQELENGKLHPPLGIDTKEKHFEYMKDILEAVRILDNKTIIIPIHYDLDEEHGLELKIVNNKVVAVDGIGETY